MFACLKNGGHWAYLLYLMLNIILYITMGSIAFYCGNAHSAMTVTSSPVNLQILPDWQ